MKLVTGNMNSDNEAMGSVKKCGGKRRMSSLNKQLFLQIHQFAKIKDDIFVLEIKNKIFYKNVINNVINVFPI